MSSNLRNASGWKSMFYELQPSNLMEVQKGYLYKSPPQSVLSKSMKSWKQRYFVLFKTNEHQYNLMYYKDENRRDKCIGEINLYQTSLLFLNPETHPTWEWIQKNFRCSSSCVLYMRVIEREYFLIGKNSSDMDGWFNAIYTALKARTHTFHSPKGIRKIRSISEPSGEKTSSHDEVVEEKAEQKKISSPPERRSAPESLNLLFSHYQYPRSFMKALLKSEDEDDEDDEEDEIEIEDNDETETTSDHYMDMASVRKALESEEDLTHRAHHSFCNGQVNENQDTEHALLNGTDKDCENELLNIKTGSTALDRQIPQGSNNLSLEEKEFSVSQEELKNNVIFSEETGKPCVSNLKHIQTSGPFHEGDQIVAINDLLTDSLKEVHTYLRRLSKDQVKLTILRRPGSRPLSGCNA